MAHLVLIVDDEPWLTNLWADALAGTGFEIVMARSATEALAELGRRQFSAVISDIRLPGLDGLRFYQEVTERFPQVARRFGFYTAYDDELARQFIATRGIPLLRKPCRVRELEEFAIRLINR